MTEPKTYPTDDGGVIAGHVPPRRTIDADGDGHPDVRDEAVEVEANPALLTIPPLARTILYYGLALGNAVCVPLVAAGHLDILTVTIIANVAGVFGFTVAANNVPRQP